MSEEPEPGAPPTTARETSCLVGSRMARVLFTKDYMG
jgi:hypothetical protein